MCVKSMEFKKKIAGKKCFEMFFFFLIYGYVKTP